MGELKKSSFKILLAKCDSDAALLLRKETGVLTLTMVFEENEIENEIFLNLVTWWYCVTIDRLEVVFQSTNHRSILYNDLFCETDQQAVLMVLYHCKSVLE